MFFRTLFKNANLPFLGKNPSRLIAVKKIGSSYVPYAKWQREQEAARIAEEEAKNEPYDLSYRSPVSTTRTQGYDFSQ